MGIEAEKLQEISRSVRITHAGSHWLCRGQPWMCPQAPRLSGWNYPQAVLCWDLGLFISSAAVL